jgi:predicted RNase H-like HicB family nuclease
MLSPGSVYPLSEENTGMSAIPTTFRIEVDREQDGRWLAEVMEVNGAMAYGSTRDEAVRKAEAIALRILAERLEHGEPAPQAFAFAVQAA